MVSTTLTPELCIKTIVRRAIIIEFHRMYENTKFRIKISV